MNTQIPLHPVDSDNIAQVGYDAESATLSVEFRGGSIYNYLGVSRDTFTAFERAPSKNKYFEAVIREHYRTVKVSPVKCFTGFGGLNRGRVVTILTRYASGDQQSDTLARGLKDASFDWGNTSDGARSLAYALLSATIGKKRASSLADAYRDRVVAYLPDDTWTLEENEIREVVDAIESAHA